MYLEERLWISSPIAMLASHSQNLKFADLKGADWYNALGASE